MARGGGETVRRPLDIPEADWQRAVGRARVIRPLAAAPRVSQAMLLRAAAELDLGVRQIQRLLRAWRAEPVATTLLFARPGVARGTRRLPAAADRLVERAIDGFYKTRERPRLTALLRQVRHDWGSAGPAQSHEAPAEPEEARVPMPTEEDIAASEFLP
ncbi:hypothetical protein [Paracraurococcus lichenis]|uniref:Helix-turn-helix domain-containing protein n=1 Tax=Paracraurococcus lichenis TaxID=3064888 RepID=A0ABT9EDY0_9PROT|nr:hypothetical protein [Paracraurococcus sp. LOR1-02]MDO9714423.1 hypothetical protein [Paracraurococcus sp. LOR1-02]